MIHDEHGQNLPKGSLGGGRHVSFCSKNLHHFGQLQTPDWLYMMFREMHGGIGIFPGVGVHLTDFFLAQGLYYYHICHYMSHLHLYDICKII